MATIAVFKMLPEKVSEEPSISELSKSDTVVTKIEPAAKIPLQEEKNPSEKVETSTRKKIQRKSAPRKVVEVEKTPEEASSKPRMVLTVEDYGL